MPALTLNVNNFFNKKPGLNRVNVTTPLLCESKNREHKNYFWNIIALRGKSQSDAR